MIWCDVSTKVGVGSTVDATMKAIQNEGLTPLAIGTVDNTGGTGQGLKILFEGEHGTDTYDGSNNEHWAHLETLYKH